MDKPNEKRSTIGSEAKINPETIEPLVAICAGWIGSADTKATSILTICGVILGLDFFKTPVTNSCYFFWLHLAFIGITLLSAIASVMVLWPQVNRGAILKKSNARRDIIPRSYRFFGELGKLSFPEFCDHMLAADELSKARDREEQVYILTVVARRKMIRVRIAAGLILVALLILGAMSIVKATIAT